MSLTRKTPLVRKAALKPGKGLARTRPPVKVAPAAVETVRTSTRRASTSPRPRRTGPSMAMRRAVHRRDKGRCVACGAPATNIQHRRARGMGGSTDAEVNRLSLLLSVCGSGTTGCHGRIESEREWARELGYAVRRNATVDAEQVPVRTVDGWQLFLDDARRIPTVTPQETP